MSPNLEGPDREMSSDEGAKFSPKPSGLEEGFEVLEKGTRLGVKGPGF